MSLAFQQVGFIKSEDFESSFNELEKQFGDNTPKLLLWFSLVNWKETCLYVLNEKEPRLRGLFLNTYFLQMQSILDFLLKRSEEKPIFLHKATTFLESMDSEEEEKVKLIFEKMINKHPERE